MKALTALLVAASLVAPSAAMARHTTPGQAERHEQAQTKANERIEAPRVANNEERPSNSHINAAKAGKVNTAKAARDGRG